MWPWWHPPELVMGSGYIAKSQDANATFLARAWATYKTIAGTLAVFELGPPGGQFNIARTEVTGVSIALGAWTSNWRVRPIAGKRCFRGAGSLACLGLHSLIFIPRQQTNCPFRRCSNAMWVWFGNAVTGPASFVSDLPSHRHTKYLRSSDVSLWPDRATVEHKPHMS
jgi:hypothetical protein